MKSWSTTWLRLCVFHRSKLLKAWSVMQSSCCSQVLYACTLSDADAEHSTVLLLWDSSAMVPIRSDACLSLICSAHSLHHSTARTPSSATTLSSAQYSQNTQLHGSCICLYAWIKSSYQAGKQASKCGNNLPRMHNSSHHQLWM